MAEITFLAPGSCQLEVTAEGSVGTDTGVDLASVSWTIEQALIAGCRFSPSAGDVHIDRNGVLTIGRSLFDRINQSADDDAIPGQCTLIIRADSTITDNVLDRFKVLVGYPGEGGGGGGGGEIGPLTFAPFIADGAPTIGSEPSTLASFWTVKLGESEVTNGLYTSGDTINCSVASGSTIILDGSFADGTECDIVTLDGSGKITDIDNSSVVPTILDDGDKLTFEMPFVGEYPTEGIPIPTKLLLVNIVDK